MNLKTGKMIERRQWTSIPMTQEAIDRVVHIGKRQKGPKCVEFRTRQGHLEGDLNLTADDGITGVHSTDIPQQTPTQILDNKIIGNECNNENEEDTSDEDDDQTCSSGEDDDDECLSDDLHDEYYCDEPVTLNEVESAEDDDSDEENDNDDEENDVEDNENDGDAMEQLEENLAMFDQAVDEELQEIGRIEEEIDETANNIEEEAQNNGFENQNDQPEIQEKRNGKRCEPE